MQMNHLLKSTLLLCIAEVFCSKIFKPCSVAYCRQDFTNKPPRQYNSNPQCGLLLVGVSNVRPPPKVKVKFNVKGGWVGGLQPERQTYCNEFNFKFKTTAHLETHSLCLRVLVCHHGCVQNCLDDATHG